EGEAEMFTGGDADWVNDIQELPSWASARSMSACSATEQTRASTLRLATCTGSATECWRSSESGRRYSTASLVRWITPGQEKGGSHPSGNRRWYGCRGIPRSGVR